MKQDSKIRRLNAIVIIGGLALFALIGVGLYLLEEERYYEFRRDFRQIPENTFLAECTDKNYPASIYGKGIEDARYWLVGEKEPDENEVSIFPLIQGWEFSSLFAPFQGSPQKWRPLSQTRLRDELGVQKDRYQTIFEDAILKCEAMLSDVNGDGALDIVLRKSQTLVASDQSATDTFVCAYEIKNGKTHFLKP